MTSDEITYYDSDRIAKLNKKTTASYGATSSDTPPTITGIILAGGTSSRFGTENKLLAKLDENPLVKLATQTLLDANLADVIVVIGHEGETVRNAISGLDAQIIENPAYESGLSTTVERGVEAATAADADAIVFLPGDMPAVDTATVNRLIDAYQAGLGTALAAANNGERGNPVLFDRQHFDDLRSVTGDVGGRIVLTNSEDAALIETNDPGVITDIDTIDDLQQHR